MMSVAAAQMQGVGVGVGVGGVQVPLSHLQVPLPLSTLSTSNSPSHSSLDIRCQSLFSSSTSTSSPPAAEIQLVLLLCDDDLNSSRQNLSNLDSTFFKPLIQSLINIHSSNNHTQSPIGIRLASVIYSKDHQASTSTSTCVKTNSTPFRSYFINQPLLSFIPRSYISNHQTLELDSRSGFELVTSLDQCWLDLESEQVMHGDGERNESKDKMNLDIETDSKNGIRSDRTKGKERAQENLRAPKNLIQALKSVLEIFQSSGSTLLQDSNQASTSTYTSSSSSVPSLEPNLLGRYLIHLTPSSTIKNPSPQIFRQPIFSPFCLNSRNDFLDLYSVCKDLGKGDLGIAILTLLVEDLGELSNFDSNSSPTTTTNWNPLSLESLVHKLISSKEKQGDVETELFSSEVEGENPSLILGSNFKIPISSGIKSLRFNGWNKDTTEVKGTSNDQTKSKASEPTKTTTKSQLQIPGKTNAPASNPQNPTNPINNAPSSSTASGSTIGGSSSAPIQAGQEFQHMKQQFLLLQTQISALLQSLNAHAMNHQQHIQQVGGAHLLSKEMNKKSQLLESFRRACEFLLLLL